MIKLHILFSFFSLPYNTWSLYLYCHVSCMDRKKEEGKKKGTTVSWNPKLSEAPPKKRFRHVIGLNIQDNHHNSQSNYFFSLRPYTKVLGMSHSYMSLYLFNIYIYIYKIFAVQLYIHFCLCPYNLIIIPNSRFGAFVSRKVRWRGREMV